MTLRIKPLCWAFCFWAQSRRFTSDTRSAYSARLAAGLRRDSTSRRRFHRLHDRIAASSMSQLDIRHASVADAARIAPLFDAYRQFYEQPADACRRAGLHQRAPGTRRIGDPAGQRGRRAGELRQMYPSFCSVIAAPIYVLYDLFVAPAARQSGAGRAAARGRDACARERGCKAHGPDHAGTTPPRSRCTNRWAGCAEVFTLHPRPGGLTPRRCVRPRPPDLEYASGLRAFPRGCGQRHALGRHRLEAQEVWAVAAPGLLQHAGLTALMRRPCSSTAAPRTKPSMAEFTAEALAP